MECMKMEVPVLATKSGVIKKIEVAKDQVVQPNVVIAVIG
jgi:biotin carboxyl carrier protein